MLKIPEYKDSKVPDPKELSVGGSCMRGPACRCGSQCAGQPWKGSSSRGGGRALELVEASGEGKVLEKCGRTP